MKLPVVSGYDVIKALQKKGFKIAGIRGSHVKLKKKINRKTILVIVPLHKELKKGTLNTILRQAGLSRHQFLNLLKDPSS